MKTIPTEPNYIIVTDAITGRKTPISWDDVLMTADLDGYKIVTDYRRDPGPFNPWSIDQHPGENCCDSCIEDAAYDISFSLWPQCCCRSRIPAEWLEARMEGTAHE